MMTRGLNKLWYQRHWFMWFLVPFSYVFQAIATLRRRYLIHFRQRQWDVPVIVVGNVTTGGVGKTPLVIALAHHFTAKGLRVGIVSRGYKAKTRHYPCLVSPDALASEVGDEPLLLAKKTGCPVVIAPRRNQAVNYLLDKHACQIIVSDDGLQHYAMGRAIEIVVIDGSRGLGNGWCLPAGPLRETKKRLQAVDFLVVNGGTWPDAFRMDLLPGPLVALHNGQSCEMNALSHSVAAVAGIGNPQRFFTTLQDLGMVFTPYVFKDHYAFKPHDFRFNEMNVVMTEKDAIKCQYFATNTMYFLPIEAKINDEFWDALWSHAELQSYV